MVLLPPIAWTPRRHQAAGPLQRRARLFVEVQATAAGPTLRARPHQTAQGQAALPRLMPWLRPR